MLDAGKPTAEIAAKLDRTRLAIYSRVHYLQQKAFRNTRPLKAGK
jgi:hypothetical protein